MEQLSGGGVMQMRLRYEQAAAERNRCRAKSMLTWALIFLVVAIIAAVFGFTGIAATSAGIARVLFFIFILFFVIALVANMI